MSWEIGISLILVGAIFTFAFLAVKVDKKHAPLQLLFLFMSILTTWLSFAIGIEIANDAAQAAIAGMLTAGYQIFIFAGIFALGYFLIMIVYNAYVSKKESGEEDDMEQED